MEIAGKVGCWARGPSARKLGGRLQEVAQQAQARATPPAVRSPSSTRPAAVGFRVALMEDVAQSELALRMSQVSAVAPSPMDNEKIAGAARTAELEMLIQKLALLASDLDSADVPVERKAEAAALWAQASAWKPFRTRFRPAIEMRDKVAKKVPVSSSAGEAVLLFFAKDEGSRVLHGESNGAPRATGQVGGRPNFGIWHRHRSGAKLCSRTPCCGQGVF